MTTFDTLKSKLCLPLLVLSLLGWGLFLWQQSQPASEPTERIVNRTQYVDRTVEKVVEKKVTRPDGTTIETIEHTNTKTKSSETVVSKSTPTLPKYSLGLAVERPATLDLTQPTQFRPELGYRLGNNLWTTTSLTVNSKLQIKAVSVGLRIDF